MTSVSKASIKAMSLTDLLGAPVPFKATMVAAKAPRVTLTTEEQKAKRNEAQRLLRSTPEGKAYANEASKKSIAKKKAKMLAEAEALKGTVAEVAEETTLTPTEVTEAIEEIIEIVAPKAPKKTKKQAVVIADVEDAPL